MSEAELQISVMNKADLADVMRIERASYQFPWSEQIVKDCLKVGYHGLVLRQEGEIRAYTFASGAAGESHILNICVDPAYRRHGYAKALLKQAIATVMVNGAKVIFLEVRESNQSAIRLYESMGFVEIGRREDYYRLQPAVSDSSGSISGKRRKASAGKAKRSPHEDALVMSRDLTLISEDDFDL